MTVKIVTDSTCDLPAEIISDLDISVIPIYINFSDQSFKDGIDITHQEYYSWLANTQTFPTTSSPSLDSFTSTYKDLIARKASGILSIHISSSISGIFTIATSAVRSFERIPIKVIDSGQLSMGTGFIVEAAARMAKAGHSLDEIVESVKNLTTRTYAFAILDTLSFLRKSGRVNSLFTRLGNLLKLTPVLKFAGGKVSMDICRTSTHAYSRMLERVRSLGNLEKIQLLHSNAPQKAKEIFKLAPDLFLDDHDQQFVDVSPVISTHLGPGAVGIACVAARPCE